MARPAGRGLERQRQQEAEAREAAKAAAGRKRGIVIALISVTVVAVAVVIIAIQPPPPGVAFADMGNQHIAAGEAHVPYNSSPPSSGPHLGSLASWGEAAQPVPPELMVHNLEDGGVVLAYDCPAGCEEFLSGLQEVLGDYAARRVLLTPYSGIVDPAGQVHLGAAVAWTRVLYFDSLAGREGRQVRSFINLYEGIDHHVG